MSISKFSTFFFLLCIALSTISCKRQKLTGDQDEFKPGKVSDVDFILVKSAFMNPCQILKPNAALLITDKREIIEDQELLLADQAKAYLCGYDYNFQFWRTSDTLIENRSFNTECVSFGYKPTESQALLNKYKALLESKPTHYIYSLELPVLIKPEDVKLAFSKSGLLILFIDGSPSRYPSVSFLYEHSSFIGPNADYEKQTAREIIAQHKIVEKISNIVNQVKVQDSILSKSDVYYGSTAYVHDTLFVKGMINLEFNFNTNVNRIANKLRFLGMKIVGLEIPRSYYVQLVDTSSNIEVIKKELKKFKLIRSVKEYSR